jgi:hypothetical protein
MKHVQKETAVLLKEKGFDLPCRQYYITVDNQIKNQQNNAPFNWNKIQAAYSAPTLYEAAEWLRAKGVHVQIIITPKGWDYDLFDSNNGKWLEDEVTPNYVSTHDEALEAGIVHALKNYVK